MRNHEKRTRIDALAGSLGGMRVLISFVLAVAVVLAAAVPAQARKNPYTAAGVCGPGFKVIDRHRLVDSHYGKLLAAVVLTYNAATGRNCAVTMKRYRVGKSERYGDWLYVDLATRPMRNPANLGTDRGDFAYFAGPVYVTARDKCVRWGGGASLLVPPNWTPRGKFNSAFRSRWSHCG